MKKLILLTLLAGALFSLPDIAKSQTSCPTSLVGNWNVGSWDPQPTFIATKLIGSNGVWYTQYFVTWQPISGAVKYAVSYVPESFLSNPDICNFLAHETRKTNYDIPGTSTMINSSYPLNYLDAISPTPSATGFYVVIEAYFSTTTVGDPLTVSKLYYTGGTPCNGCLDSQPNILSYYTSTAKGTNPAPIPKKK